MAGVLERVVADALPRDRCAVAPDTVHARASRRRHRGYGGTNAAQRGTRYRQHDRVNLRRRSTTSTAGSASSRSFRTPRRCTSRWRSSARPATSGGATIVERTLDAMADGGLWDARGGGFYRYATSRDWQLPHTEKLLETNAELLRVYAEAALVFGRQVDRDRCAAIAGVHHRRAARRGRRLSRQRRRRDALHGRQREGGRGAARRRDRPRRQRARPRSARLVRARDPALLQARRRASRTTPTAWRASAGCSPTRSTPPARCSTRTTSAALEPYKMMAEELTHVAVRELWDDAGGGFFDRAGHDVRHRPAARAAEAVRRSTPRRRRCWRGWSGSTRRRRVPRARAKARSRAASAQLAGQGPLAAHYVLGARQLCEPVIS